MNTKGFYLLLYILVCGTLCYHPFMWYLITLNFDSEGMSCLCVIYCNTAQLQLVQSLHVTSPTYYRLLCQT